MQDRKKTDLKTSSSTLTHIICGLIILVAVITTGTAGYMVIEKWRFLDALYMTIITITTVGFKEVGKVSDTGRIFTLVLIFMGMGIIGYTLGTSAQVMIEFQLRNLFGRRKLGHKIKKLKDHYIICGYDRIGRVIVDELLYKKIPMVVIDKDPDVERDLSDLNVPYIIDDATMEDVLIKAGIIRAKGLVSAVSTDADNLFITMTARGLKPDIFILARAREEQSYNKFIRGGANRVVLPYLIGGQKMAHIITKPIVSEFLELTVHGKEIELGIEELGVSEKSQLHGKTLATSGIRQKLNVMIVAIMKQNGSMLFNPPPDALITAGDVLIALGQKNDLNALKVILSGK